MKLLSALLSAALLFAPLPSTAESHRAGDVAVAEARALIEAGRYDDALVRLRGAETDVADPTNALFLTGLAAIGAALRKEDEGDREALLDEAIVALRAILAEQPGLVRVRLELARAFFLKGDYDLARTHFEQILAGRLPPPVVANVTRFLTQIRARRRWSSYVGASVAPDSNIGAATESEIIYIYGLPFRRDGEVGASSGLGLSLWGGGEYQYPVSDKTRLRSGFHASRREYAGRGLDQTFAAVHLGPRWLLSRTADVSVLATAEQRWSAGKRDSQALGARLETWRRLSPRLSARVRASWQSRINRTSVHLDGPVLSLSASGSLVVSPTVRVDGVVGYNQARPRVERWRNTSRSMRLGATKALPRGFTISGSGERRWTSYEGNWFPNTDGTPRRDRSWTLRASLLNRSFTVLGFSPELALVREVRSTNAQLYDYQRNRVELLFQRQFLSERIQGRRRRDASPDAGASPGMGHFGVVATVVDYLA